MALTACSAADRGALEPVAGSGVTLTKTHGLPGDTARLAAGGVVADVTGSWSSTGESIEIVYRGGTVTATIAMVSSSAWKGQAIAFSAAWDRTPPAPGNALGRPLSSTAPLHLAASDRRTVQIEYDRPSTSGGRPALGDDVVIAIPMPGGAQPVHFRVDRE